MHWHAGWAHLFVSAIASLLAATIRASDRNHNLDSRMDLQMPRY